jgi:hypothetical protein
MNKLKSYNIPWHARAIFRIQFIPEIIFILGCLLLMPFLAVLAIFSDTSLLIIENLSKIMEHRTEILERKRDRLIKLWSETEIK